jgi:hypothetical protein
MQLAPVIPHINDCEPSEVQFPGGPGAAPGRGAAEGLSSSVSESVTVAPRRDGCAEEGGPVDTDSVRAEGPS